MKHINYKDISFYPINDSIPNFIESPSPSSKTIPEWYKGLPRYMNNDEKFTFKNGAINLTAKSCMPLLDSFASGYMFLTPFDIRVHRDADDNVTFKWSFNNEKVPPFVRSRGRAENDSCPWIYEENYGYDKLEFSWMPFWSVKTPKGYSTIFTHPLNRIDLPFYTLGGILDTDGWGEAGNQPFLIKSGWQGTIPKNTPFLQIIPFKREDWKSSINNDMSGEHIKQIVNRNRFLKGFYKNKIWKSKTYR